MGRSREKEHTVKHRLLNHVVVALVVGAVAVPLAHATGYDGYKSSYPQLHEILSGAVSDPGRYEGYKSSYPQLHQVLSGAVGDPGSTVDDGYKSSYPPLHAVLSHQVGAPFVPKANGFDWRDAAIGAGTAAVAILLIAGTALFLTRRRVRVA
jgi:hypothetical protein